ncbi:MAG: response regulator [Desulfobacula sp.]|nr:response regulator [Desulfobacula sp.]
MMEVDPRQLKEAFKNIFLNAHETMEESKEVAIVFNSHQTNKELVVISVIDQGRGIKKENLEKVFEPYYSTKPLGKDKGIGLGMSIAYSIIKKHQGDILISSAPKKGTRVDIILPVSQKKEKLNKPQPVSHQKHPSEERENNKVTMILVMDDDKMVREISEKILTHLGYKVIVAENGEKAVKLYKKQLNAGVKISIVILDLEVKHGMGGAQTIEKLLKINPDIKAVIASGYSSDMIMENCRDYGFALALPKPFSMKELKAALDQLQ